MSSKRNTKWFWSKTKGKDWSFSAVVYLIALRIFSLKLDFSNGSKP